MDIRNEIKSYIVREGVTTGQDCGLNIESFNDIRVGDIVEGYEQVEVKRK